LPEPGPDTVNKIYLVAHLAGSETDYYEEYITVENNGYAWEKIGTTQFQITVDTELSDTSENPVQNKVITTTLKNYVKNTDMADGITETPGLVKLKSYGQAGLQISSQGYLTTQPPSIGLMCSRDSTRPLVSSNIGDIIHLGITGYIERWNGSAHVGSYGNQKALTDEEKEIVCEWLGVNERIASNSGIVVLEDDVFPENLSTLTLARLLARTGDSSLIVDYQKAVVIWNPYTGQNGVICSRSYSDMLVTVAVSGTIYTYKLVPDAETEWVVETTKANKVVNMFDNNFPEAIALDTWNTIVSTYYNNQISVVHKTGNDYKWGICTSVEMSSELEAPTAFITLGSKLYAYNINSPNNTESLIYGTVTDLAGGGGGNGSVVFTDDGEGNVELVAQGVLVGDIETALDAILDIQNSVIGGTK
jgi:hypothetical protein